VKTGARDFEGALAEFEWALRIVPGFPKYVLSRARALEQLDRDEDALAGYRKAASLLAKDGSGNEAVRAFHAGLRVQAHAGAAFLLAKAKRWEEAAREFGRARACAPDDPFLAVSHAEALEASGSKAQALEAFEEALRGLDSLDTPGDADLARKAFAMKKAREGLERLK
jgi:tetratricopeptide (TPR) repeat protein